MIKYQQEFLSQVEEEITPLAELEWEESGHPTEPLKNPIGNFLTRMGYNEVETKYEKVL